MYKILEIYNISRHIFINMQYNEGYKMHFKKVKLAKGVLKSDKNSPVKNKTMQIRASSSYEDKYPCAKVTKESGIAGCNSDIYTLEKRQGMPYNLI